MPKGSKELTESRRNEILNAARTLYRTKSFNEITIKDIATSTSFTRTSIYNYFETKEEIFLSLLKAMYEEWISELEKILNENETLSKEEFSSLFSQTLENSEELLKLLSTNLYDIEKNSRYSFLLDLKRSYKRALETVSDLLRKFFSFREEGINSFLYSFFPFMYGVYPYTRFTEKQERAIKEVGIIIEEISIKDFVYKTVIKLL